MDQFFWVLNVSVLEDLSNVYMSLACWFDRYYPPHRPLGLPVRVLGDSELVMGFPQPLNAGTTEVLVPGGNQAGQGQRHSSLRVPEPRYIFEPLIYRFRVK